jgi:hypothetical protein
MVFLLVGLFSTGEGLMGNDIIVKSQSDQEIVIEFSPQHLIVNPEIVNAKSYYVVKFENCYFKNSSGHPSIPGRIVTVAIPFGAKVSVELLKAEKSKTIDGILLPTPGFSRDSVSEFIFSGDEAIYQSGQPFHQQLIEISPPAMIRDQQVVTVSFYPVQFFPKGNQIQLFDRIEARINFIGGQYEKQYMTRFEEVTSENGLFINPGQAAKWRKQKILKKQTGLKKDIPVEYYKIWIRDDGIYRITGTDLKDAGIDIGEIKPFQIKLFNNGGFQLPLSIHDEGPDSLIENAIFVSDGGDRSFDSQDYILFYGKSVNGWKYNSEQRSFSHYLHSYTLENVYWLCWQDPDSGKRMLQKDLTPTSSIIEINSFYDHLYVENEYKNPFDSGTIWLGNYFSTATPERSYTFDLPGALQDKEAMVKVNLAGISGGEQKFWLYLNDMLIAQIPTFYSNSGEYLNISMQQFYTTFQVGLQEGYNRFTVKYLSDRDVNLAYMDWIELAARRQLKAKNDQLVFYGPDSTGLYKYLLNSFSSDNISIYDITKYYDVCQLKLHNDGSGAVEFVDSTYSDSPPKYFAIAPKAFKSPVKIQKDVASDWRNTSHAVDFVIICYDNFYDAALALKSLRENCDTLKTVVVKISDVYDEFSWGLTDPSAIRDFIKYAYNNWQKSPEYVLLFGDGDYDYKNIVSPYDPDWIPAFETPDLNERLSLTRDDWYVCIAGDDDLPDLAIGRLPVRTPDEAFAVVQKIIDYENSPEIGEWCNTITMVADDEYGQGGNYDAIDHIPDANEITENLIPQNYNVRKIYLTEYPVIHDASISGIRKPAAHEVLMKQIDRGSLIINFIGHGNEQVWTHEHILTLAEDLPQFNNGQKQAFWIAATCNFGRFDNPNFQSFAEQLVTMAKHGAIAVFSTCRLAEPLANVSLNRSLYRFLFNPSNAIIRLGDAVMLAKNSTGNSKNDQLFHLLGDPTLRLAMPKCLAQITSCNPDSMKALCKMEVAGKVQQLGDQGPDFDGQVLFKAFDSQKQRNYIVNQWKTYEYKLPGNAIFRGEVSVTDGRFNTQFIIPKDISYGGGEGRFSAFYWQDDLFGAGNRDNIIVGGTQLDFDDQDGPNIIIGFEGQDFLSGGFAPPNPVLKVVISDSLSGVNIAGDIGHKITMILDNDETEKVELNDYFHYDRDSYQVGHLSYPLIDLSEGIHHVQIKAWDNCNNSSQSEIEFNIINLGKLIIRDLLNYPNPFSNSTEFTFWASQDCNVQINIYTLSGRLICKLDDLNAQIGFNHFHWNGRDQDGDPLANGVYLYKIYASCFNGSKNIHAEQIEKCVIMR